MTPKQVRVMGVYFKAAERLAWATEDLINAHECRKAGLLGNCERFEVARFGWNSTTKPWPSTRAFGTVETIGHWQPVPLASTVEVLKEIPCKCLTPSWLWRGLMPTAASSSTNVVTVTRRGLEPAGLWLVR